VIFLYYLDTFGAENGDSMGVADLQDLKLTMESLMKLEAS
jgi:hypothetical protein